MGAEEELKEGKGRREEEDKEGKEDTKTQSANLRLLRPRRVPLQSALQTPPRDNVAKRDQEAVWAEADTTFFFPLSLSSIFLSPETENQKWPDCL